MQSSAPWQEHTPSPEPGRGGTGPRPTYPGRASPFPWELETCALGGVGQPLLCPLLGREVHGEEPRTGRQAWLGSEGPP